MSLLFSFSYPKGRLTPRVDDMALPGWWASGIAALLVLLFFRRVGLMMVFGCDATMLTTLQAVSGSIVIFWVLISFRCYVISEIVVRHVIGIRLIRCLLIRLRLNLCWVSASCITVSAFAYYVKVGRSFWTAGFSQPWLRGLRIVA